MLLLLPPVLLLGKVCQLSRHDGRRGHHRRKDKGASGALSPATLIFLLLIIPFIVVVFGGVEPSS